MLAWCTLFVLCTALFLDVLDFSMINVALPSIRTDLHMSTSSLQWVVSAYVLGYGGFLLLGGRAADLFGRRRVFLVALAVFAIASLSGGFATAGTLLIVTRFVKGVSAAFTLPAALSIITTTFPEGPARNKALSVFTGAAAAGFSLGLVIGGLLTSIGWRWVFFTPAPVALVALVAGVRLVATDNRAQRTLRTFDVAGAVSMTAAVLLLVYTLVQAPQAGWISARTLGSLIGAAAISAAFVVRERRARAPLIRLGILRSSSLRRANLGAMSWSGSWVGFLFITTLYLQQLRGWSALGTGFAIFPAGFIVLMAAPHMLPWLIERFGVMRLIEAGMVLSAAGYALFLSIGFHSGYAFGMLPTFLLPGAGIALLYGPLNIAGTSGIAPEEQGLAGALLNTSIEFGGALGLAVVTAVINADVGSAGTPQATLNAFHAAIFVPVGLAALGAVATITPHKARRKNFSAGRMNQV